MQDTDWQRAKTKRDSALDESGIGYDLEQRLEKSVAEITDFCAKLQKRAISQAVYDETVNRPCEIHVGAGHALRSGIVGAIGELVKWDVYAALRIAADIAEDVNAHGEAQAIRGMATYEISA